MSAIDPSRKRNVGIVGHGGVGKTMLIEHMLHLTGATKRIGTIEEGNTVCDYLEEEVQRKHSITMKLCHLDWNGVQVHLVDHPGYADFLGEMAASTPMIDGMVIVVDATTGIQVGTDNAWRFAEEYNVPRAFFINKLDREHTSFNHIVQTLRETYGKRCVPLVVPLGEGSNISGVVNIFDEDTSGLAEEIARLHDEIADVVAETDDKLLEKYLETGELTADEFHKGLHDGITSGKVIPIIAGSVVKGLGMRRLLNVIADSFPHPLDRHVMVEMPGGEQQELEVSADAPFVGQVFRSVVDPYVGHLTLFRVLTGTLHGDSEFYNVNRGLKERTGKLFVLNGKQQTQVAQVGPGDLAAMTKLKNTHFGDTIAAPGVDYKLPEIKLPDSMVKLAIFPKSRGDEDKIGEALNRLAEEDPTFAHYRDEATGEHLIRGMGDLQLDIFLDRMKRKYHVEAETRTPRVAYRETIRGKTEVHARHKKQSGGHGQFADVQIRLSPNERGGGFQFIDSIVGGVVPRQYIPAVEKGAQEALSRGVMSGNPVVDIVVELFFGSYHDVDSSEMAFKIAASMAIQKGVRDAKPCILEPIMEIAVTVPEEYMGDITGDLNSRRGRILGMDSLGGGRQRIKANVPEAEILRYSTDLRSRTSGRGSFDLKFSHYDQAPEHVAQELIGLYEKARAAGE